MLRATPLLRESSLLGLVLVVAALLPAFAAAPAAAVPARGYVDGAPFANFASEDGEVVEVNVSGSMLRALANTLAGEDKEAAAIMSKLVAIHAVIVGIDDDRVDAAMKHIEATGKDLLLKGWEELARVRDKNSRIRVLVLNDQDKIAGLVVMMVDRNGGHQHGPPKAKTDDDDDSSNGPQLVFANIAGHLQLSDVQRLSGHLDVPGLDQLGLETVVKHPVASEPTPSTGHEAAKPTTGKTKHDNREE